MFNLYLAIISESNNPFIDNIINNEYFGTGLILFAIAAIALAIFFMSRGFLVKTFNYLSSADLVIYLVTVPKESAKEATDEKNLQAIQEDIAVAETLYSLLGGIKSEKGPKTWLRGRQDNFSLEIIAQKGLISFYVAVPKKLQQYFENQLHAVYSQANLEEVEDYNLFTPQGAVLGSYLRFSREYIFPIKTYKRSESDPLNSLTNILSRVDKDEGAAIQIVARSSGTGWRHKGYKVASEMQQGKKLKEALQAAGLTSFLFKFFNFFDFFWGFFKTTKKSNEFEKIQSEKVYRLSPLEEEMVKGIEEKVSKAGLEVNLRIITSSADKARSRTLLENIVNAFTQFNIYQYGNSFKWLVPVNQRGVIEDFIYRNLNERYKLILNTEELASIYHLPLPTTETPNIRWLTAKRTPPPVNMPTEGLILGQSVYRGQEVTVRVKEADRRRHIYSIGMTGTGKSNLLSNLAIQDIQEGRGVCVIDPHGDLVEDCLRCIPAERADDVVYFNPADSDRPMGINLLEYDPKYPEQKTFVINEMIKIFDKLYDLKQTGGPMFEQYMRNAMLLVMEDPASGSTLMEIPKVLADSEFRNYKLTKCQNPIVYDFWTKEAQKAGGEAALANLVPYITSKLTQFVSNDIMRPIIGQQKSAFNFRQIMDEQKIFLINLSKGKLGDINAYLLGMVLVGKILMASLSQADLPQEQRKDFYLYIDEFQNFITDTIAVILSEARKYRLNLILAHQYIGQLVKATDTTIRDAIFGNVGTIICFRIGVEDAEVLAKQLAPVVNEFDLMNIEKYHAYVRLLIDNTASKAFLMKCPPPPSGDQLIKEKIKELSRLKYGREKNIVETEINQRLKIIRTNQL